MEEKLVIKKSPWIRIIRFKKNKKHIAHIGLTLLASMFTTALNKNRNPRMWRLATIVLIPKPHKDTNMGTSYRPISLLSVATKTLEK